jgi:LEA14-like dessication related protein
MPQPHEKGMGKSLCQTQGFHWSTTMFMQAHVTRLLGVALLLGLISGCSSVRVSDWQDPQVRLLEVEVVKARLTRQDFKLRLRVDNPNDRSVLVRSLRYKITLNDLVLTEGESTDWFVVEAHSHRNFVVPVRTNLWKDLKPVAKMLKKADQPIRYRLDGKLKTGFLFRHNVRIGRNGEIIPGDLIPE